MMVVMAESSRHPHRAGTHRREVLTRWPSLVSALSFKDNRANEAIFAVQDLQRGAPSPLQAEREGKGRGLQEIMAHVVQRGVGHFDYAPAWMMEIHHRRSFA